MKDVFFTRQGLFQQRNLFFFFNLTEILGCFCCSEVALLSEIRNLMNVALPFSLLNWRHLIFNNIIDLLALTPLYEN